MRLWHLTFGVVVVAVILSLAQDPVGCAAVIVFFTGLGEIFLATTALLVLFQTLGALGEARGPVAHIQAVAATTVVVVLASSLMWGWLFIGFRLLQVAVA